MKILICCPFVARGYGGLERVGVDLANYLSGKGYAIALLYYDESLPKFPIYRNIALINNLQSFSNTVNKVAKFNPDVFLAMSSGFLSIYMAKIASEIGCPLTFHESSMHFRFCGPHWAEKRNICFEEATLEREAICSLAVRIRHVLNHSIYYLPKYLAENVRVFPNPVNFKINFQNKRKQICSDKYIINIGGLKKVKNILPALQAFSRLSKNYPDWKIKIYGRGFPREKSYQETIYKFIESHNLESKVLFMGECNNIEKEYRKADIHISTSLVENFNMAAAESIVCGVPTIAFSESYGTSELIKHQHNGLLVKQKEGVDGLEIALKKLMNDYELRQFLSRNSLEDSKIFSAQNIYPKWEQFFEEAYSYKDSSDKLLLEYISRDRERALFARRKAISLLSAD
jgi:glycosyltransferase involved in cell wall biosynthesis